MTTPPFPPDCKDGKCLKCRRCMTDIQRHNMTCPYCNLLTEHGLALDGHLRAAHGISDRHVLYRIYRHQVMTAPGIDSPVPEPLPRLHEEME